MSNQTSLFLAHQCGLVLSSTPLLTFIGLAVHTTSGSSATSHSQYSWVTYWIIRPTIFDQIILIGYNVRLPQLQHWLPDRNFPLKHSIGLTKYRASRYYRRLPPPMPPKQVTVSCVPLSSYGFFQTLPLASKVLAIQIIFPLVRVTPLSFKWTGLPASLGKHKKIHLFR